MNSSASDRTFVVFLDLDGVLTTTLSRAQGGPTAFDSRAMAALERLLAETGALVVVHSSWRKLPEAPPGPPWPFPVPHGWWFWSLPWFKALCKFQGMRELPARLYDVAPVERYSSTRGADIATWIHSDGSPDEFYIILDDETSTIEAAVGYMPNVLIVSTDDDVGLTEDQVDKIIDRIDGYDPDEFDDED